MSNKKDFKALMKDKSKSLLNEEINEVKPGESVVLIPKEDIYSSEQVRKFFDEEYIAELSKNMDDIGQIQPIVVTHKDIRGYKIQVGECRWRAANLSDKITHVECLVRDAGTVLAQLSENLHRNDLTPFETGRALELLMEEQGIVENQDLANVVSLSESRISAFRKAAQCPPYIELAYHNGIIRDVDTVNSLRIAGELSEVKTKKLLESPVSRKDAKELVKSLKASKKEAKSKQVDKEQPSPEHQEVTNEASLNEVTQTRVSGASPTPQNNGIRISFEGVQGFIDLYGQADSGQIVIVLDGSSGKLTVPANEISVVGYHSLEHVH
ncbi:ParB/RepB/Spo0J family partition protein [Vibrio lentus]|nr:ParB/RepB/Spo0J family partition protein [Vibrio lentus]PMI60757.1 chromosome partitioning protein ParB [Vibrio lentus]